MKFKKSLSLTFICAVTLFSISCGPSSEEIQAKHELEKKALADSILNVHNQEIAKAEEKRIEEQKKAIEEQKRLDEYNSQPEVIREKLKQKERNSPLDYLSVKYATDYSVWSSKDVLKGTISSSASIATFKDIGLKVHCYSKTKTLIKTIKYALYEFVPAKGSKDFEIKFNSPSGTKSIGMEIYKAEAK